MLCLNVETNSRQFVKTGVAKEASASVRKGLLMLDSQAKQNTRSVGSVRRARRNFALGPRWTKQREERGRGAPNANPCELHCSWCLSSLGTWT